MNRKSLSAVLLDAFVFLGMLTVFWIVLSYWAGIHQGEPHNRIMDVALAVSAIAFPLILTVGYFRSGQHRYDWSKDDDETR